MSLNLNLVLFLVVVLALRWPKTTERVFAKVSTVFTRRRVRAFVVLFVMFNLFFGYGFVARVAYAYEAANECKFLADGDNTGEKSKHMNGYNVCVSNAIMAVTTTTQPFPAIRDSLERKMLIEKLMRFQDPNKLGWMYFISQNGAVWNQYTVHGKPSSTQSSLTPAWQASDNDGQSTNVKILIPSSADDGSFGPNEGGDAGIFFFTTEGCLIEKGLDWVYSDCQLNVSDSYIVGWVDANGDGVGDPPTPSNNAGCLDGSREGGCTKEIGT